MGSITTDLGGWADAELESFESDGSSAEVRVELWNASTLSLRFSDVILLHFDQLDVIADVVEITESSDAMRHALSRTYDGTPPDDHPFREYAIVDIDGVHGLTVIAAEMRIEAVEKSE